MESSDKDGRLSHEAIDDPKEDLRALLIGEGDPSACEEGYHGAVAQSS
jgi:hypothetical protein